MRKHVADRKVLDSLVGRLERAAPDSPRQWGTMNVHQMLLHLGYAAAAALGQREFSTPPRKSAGTLVRILALYVLPRTPRGVKSGANPAAFICDETTFARDRQTAIAKLLEVATPGQPLAPAHPFFGPMSRGDWMRFVYLHTDHHLRQFGL